MAAAGGSCHLLAMTRRWLTAPIATLCLLGCGEQAPLAGRNDASPPMRPGPTNEASSETSVANEPTAPREPTAPPPSPPTDPAPAAPPAEPEAIARTQAAAFEARYPLHGLTFHFLARVRARPHHESPVVGYMRRGARFRASERVPGVGCARGWFEVPGQGYVCRGQGYLIGAEPPSFEPTPVPAALEDALPYAYAYTTRGDVPQYWRIPTPAEEAAVEEAFAALTTNETAAAAQQAQRQAAEAEALVAAEAAAEPEPGLDAGIAETPTGASDEESTVAPAVVEAEAPPPPGAGAEERAQGNAEGEDAVDPSLVAAAQGTVSIPDFVRLRMRRGFYVSLDGEEEDAGRRFLRTVRGAFVRAEHLRPNEPPTHRGVVLGGRWQLPVAFVYRTGTHKLRRVPSTGRLEDLGVLERHTPFPVADRLTRQRRAYLVARDGYVVRRSSLRVAEAIERPDSVPPDARWVHVRLSEQTLVAYEGDRPVFATTVSTGRAGFETPTGLFRIQSKHVSTTMDDLNAGEESYLIEDVPWTMYFEGNYALHAAFWHEGFGRVRSHGCVNLAPTDARWIFQWSSPTLPAGWHGIFADQRARPGTWILITD